MRRINKSKVFTFALLALSLIILGTTIYYVAKIEVIKDWVLALPSGDIHAGDTIIVKSTYTKVRDVTGKASRYVECWTRDNLLISYPINEAVADKAAGARKGTGVVLVMPTTIPDLPAKCDIRVNVCYPVLPFRTVCVSNTTSDFTLLPVKVSQTDSGQAVTQTATSGNQSLALSGSQSQLGSSTNNTSNSQTAQSNSSQNMQTDPANKPGVIDQILNFIGGL